MPADKFSCYLVSKNDNGKVAADVVTRSCDDLPPGDVLIRVAYSAVNYKDGLAATGHPGVVRTFPHVPGIDAAGTVVESKSWRFHEGDEVLVTGFELGARAWGGFAEYIRVPEDWIVPLPEGLSLRESMIYGTAGFTAGLALEKLQERDIQPDRGEVVVTGASGGVGSLTVAVLAKAGYQVVASTGKPTAHELLKKLGASRVISRGEVSDVTGKPLLSGRWAAAVDTVGGKTLSTLVRSVYHDGCVAACGLVSGVDLHLTVFPFILRGVSLDGIDSAEYKIERRGAIWEKLAGEWKPDNLESLVTGEVDLGHLEGQLAAILGGRQQGRVLVKPTGGA